MRLPPFHLAFVAPGFAAVVHRMVDFVALHVRRSDQGMTPSLSPGRRMQTVALHRRLLSLTGEFLRLASLAAAGRLRAYPNRALPGPGSNATARRPAASPPPYASPFGAPTLVAQGPTLPPLPTHAFGWMLGFVPAACRDALAGWLANPEMVALIGASPAVARLLRPLCRGLGVTPPDGVFPAPRRPASAPRRASRPGLRTGARSSTQPVAGIAREVAPRCEVLAHAKDVVASPQARDRWWAQARHAGRDGAAASAAMASRGAPARDRSAKH